MPSDKIGSVTSIRARGKIKVLEVWFDDMPSSVKEYDLLVSHQRSQPITQSRCLYFYTILINLSRTDAELLADMAKGTAYEIRRARDKDKVICRITLSPMPDEINEFIAFYVMTTHLPEQGQILQNRLLELHNSELLGLSWAFDTDRLCLVWHAYICHERQHRARLLHSISLQQPETDQAMRNLICRANRYLHYNDMLVLKEHGYQFYDFGGWYAGIEDNKRLQINKFKESFGGQIIYGYDCEEPLSPRGWAYYICRTIWQRLLDPKAISEIKRRRKEAPLAPKY